MRNMDEGSYFLVLNKHSVIKLELKQLTINDSKEQSQKLGS